MQEVLSRKGNIYLLSTDSNADVVIDNSYFANVFSIITIFQLIAYHTALQKKLDIDKPRNLAKSVTVE